LKLGNISIIAGTRHASRGNGQAQLACYIQMSFWICNSSMPSRDQWRKSLK